MQIINCPDWIFLVQSIFFSWSFEMTKTTFHGNLFHLCLSTQTVNLKLYLNSNLCLKVKLNFVISKGWLKKYWLYVGISFFTHAKTRNLWRLHVWRLCTIVPKPFWNWITEGSRLMRISLLRFFKKILKFALCEFMSYALGYFISLVDFLAIFANANFC